MCVLDESVGVGGRNPHLHMTNDVAAAGGSARTPEGDETLYLALPPCLLLRGRRRRPEASCGDARGVPADCGL